MNALTGDPVSDSRVWSGVLSKCPVTVAWRGDVHMRPIRHAGRC